MPDAVPVAGSQFQKVCCPECGGISARSEDLYRTRRKPGMLWIAGVLGLLIYPVFKGGEILRWGPTALVPSTLLIAFFESAPEELVLDNSAIASIARNTRGLILIINNRDALSNRRLWAWQRAWLSWRLKRIWADSNDVGTIWRAFAVRDDFSWLGKSSEPYVRIAADRYIRIAEHLFDPDPRRAGGAMDVLGCIGPADRELPRSEILAAHAADLDQMMRGTGVDTQIIACRVVESAGVAFDPYLTTLVGIAKPGSQFPQGLDEAYEALAGLSMTSDKALKAFIDLYPSTGEGRSWQRAAERLRECRKEIAELLGPP